MENGEENKIPEVEFASVEEEKTKVNEGLLELNKKLSQIFDIRKRIKEMLVYMQAGAGVSEDEEVIDRLKKKVIETSEEITTLLEGQFDLLFAEIDSGNNITSSSGRVYTPREIIDSIKMLKKQAEAGEKFEMSYVTRANNLRDRAEVLLNMIVKLKEE